MSGFLAEPRPGATVLFKKLILTVLETFTTVLGLDSYYLSH